MRDENEYQGVPRCSRGESGSAQPSFNHTYQELSDAALRRAVSYVTATQGDDRSTLTVDAGFLISFAAGRVGRRTSSPPQFAQTNFSLLAAQLRQ